MSTETTDIKLPKKKMQGISDFIKLITDTATEKGYDLEAPVDEVDAFYSALIAQQPYFSDNTGLLDRKTLNFTLFKDKDGKQKLYCIGFGHGSAASGWKYSCVDPESSQELLLLQMRINGTVSKSHPTVRLIHYWPRRFV